jgi:hypothetical protein
MQQLIILLPFIIILIGIFLPKIYTTGKFYFDLLLSLTLVSIGVNVLFVIEIICKHRLN